MILYLLCIILAALPQFVQALLSLVRVASGIAISIIFPNPITIGVLDGAATLIAQNSNVFGKVKKIKEKSKEKNKNKEEVKNMAVEQHNRRVAKDVQSIIYQQEIRNNQAEPSAP